ncbi:PREDICTED: agamous-like MADS-box protein AGL61 [Theobroma cacao]|uniref:Agamous-like MADS-box protein AGL61 n=1 Tax=Theobroma cacao TaxID=3641 RepID=A0AB32V0L6_THECC|nr:PREDICTED: agamous-like MADS-box protein AGL61 [Theobroma cacao]
MENASNTTDATKTKKSRGRQRIEIKKLEDECKRQVTFSKRRKGLFNKATEVSTLCGAEVAILALSKSGRVYTTDGVDAVLDRYVADSSDSNPLPKQKEVEEDNAGFWWDQPIDNLTLGELVEYTMALNDLRETAVARLEELNIQNSTHLWPFVADEDVSEADFVHQFMVERNYY